MTLNHSKFVAYTPIVHFLFWYGMHSRDATVLVDYCD